MKKRSVGVTLTGVLFLLFGVGILVGVADKNKFLYLTAILNIICGLGLICLMDWLRKFTIFYMSFLIVMNIVLYSSFFETNLAHFSSYSRRTVHLFTLARPLFEGAVIIFLTRSKIKQQFK